MNITMNNTQPSSCPSTKPTTEKIEKTFPYCLIFLVSLAWNTVIGLILYRTKTMRKTHQFFNRKHDHLRSAVVDFCDSSRYTKSLHRLLADRWSSTSNECYIRIMSCLLIHMGDGTLSLDAVRMRNASW